jgi:hypothetical protein
VGEFLLSSFEKKGVRIMWRCVLVVLRVCVLLAGASGCGGGNVSNPQGPKDVKGPG